MIVEKLFNLVVFTTATYVILVKVVLGTVICPRSDVPLKLKDPPLSVGSNVPIFVITTFPPSEPRFVHVLPLYELLFVASRYKIGEYDSAPFSFMIVGGAGVIAIITPPVADTAPPSHVANPRLGIHVRP